VDVPPELIGYVRSAATFIEEFDFQAWYTEAVVHSADEHDHAGKLDAIGSILLPDYPSTGSTPRRRGPLPGDHRLEDFGVRVYGRAPTSSGRTGIPAGWCYPTAPRSRCRTSN